jgi:anti-sigma B factor antagonist
MSTPECEYFFLRRAGDVVVIEMKKTDIQGPDLCRALIDELMSVVELEEVTPILLNLRGPIHFSSMGYAALFKLVKYAKERKRPIRFCNMHPDVRVGCDIVGLPLVVEIDDTEADALEAFAQA